MKAWTRMTPGWRATCWPATRKPFDRFVARFRPKIFQYSWLMCGHREDAEEVAQETLLRVFESFDQLRDPDRVRAWVFRIAKNACLMKRRRSRYAPSHQIPLDDDQSFNRLC